MVTYNQIKVLNYMINHGIRNLMQKWSDYFRYSGWKQEPFKNLYHEVWAHGDFKVRVHFKGEFVVFYHTDDMWPYKAKSSWNIWTADYNDLLIFFRALTKPEELPLCLGIPYAEPIVQEWFRRYHEKNIHAE